MTTSAPWGKSASIDLHGCDFNQLSRPEPIKEFISHVITLINMQPHGPTYIDRFGDPKTGLEGWSAMQFIETSSITVHADEVSNRCFIDIFSCQDFDPQVAADYAKSHFGAKEMKVTFLIR